MTSSLDLSSVPPIYILPTHLQTDDLHEAEDSLYHAGGHLSYNAGEAHLFLGRVSQKKRAAFDLRSRGVWTEPADLPTPDPTRKKRKLSPISSDGGQPNERVGPINVNGPVDGDSLRNHASSSMLFPDLKDHVLVLRLDWLDNCLKENTVVPYGPYLVYWGKVVPKPAGAEAPESSPKAVTYIKATRDFQSVSTSTTTTPKKDTISSILARAQADNPSSSPISATSRRSFHSHPALTHSTRPPKLQRTTTSEFENLDSRSLPPLPDWAKNHVTYSCLRSTPPSPPNAAFIAQLEKIKLARLLTLDEIGVRAYSTSVASLSAYPFAITTPLEITRLPGCNEKIALLWSEWDSSGTTDSERYIQAIGDLESDTDLKHLHLFWEIWGVGPDTARKFYFEYGWKDLDDVVEFGWTSLSRVQQIGVKFYDEFLDKIPRKEVEAISDTILRHARLCRNISEEDWGTDKDMVCVIVGGYRRGKAFCGDVDVILSHRDEEATKNLVVDIVASLETEGWVTHTLTLNTTTSDRGQQTLPYRSEGHGAGFDSLDKALCVWQDPHFTPPTDEPGAKNPNIHRRVDIIISTWRTVGCAVLGWSGGTTFQRDIRRYVSKVKGWKFDSSGIRDRGNGMVLDLEAPREGDTADDWEDRERRLMDGMGIGWRPATERCTG